MLSHDTVLLSRFLYNSPYGSQISPILSSSSVHFLSPNSLCSISSSFSLIISMVHHHLLCLPFYHLQFLSSLLQYSLLYFLSIYPNSFLTINLPGNFPLANIPLFSSLSCLCISSISLLYSISNSSTISLAFPKFSSPSHISNSTMNLFYCTKYLS